MLNIKYKQVLNAYNVNIIIKYMLFSFTRILVNYNPFIHYTCGCFIGVLKTVWQKNTVYVLIKI
ncbi:hypothetical protein KUTeg_017651 [Tegillarca granosa]|uniref:Uncharacterized protein n=1 Tax=Tegillarca granosa TaxID=220873 RepID=A0ABQ9EFI7_TEGGR|nr:hypothetical protein KUTeg_017651 [Tegillarca granosa]